MRSDCGRMSSLATELRDRAPRLGRPPDPRRSLVGRLVWLAAVWCILALAVTGFVLTSLSERAAVRRLDGALSIDADDLYAGVSVGPGGAVFAPAITDARATRPYSGKYWQVGVVAGDGRVRALPDARSRSLWDTEDLAVPPALLSSLGREPSGRAFFDGPGPHGQHLRIAAMERRLTGRADPVILMTAQDRSAIDEDVREFALATSIALLLLGAGVVSAVILQVRVGLRPLFAMRRDVATVRQGGAERLTGEYPSELTPLATELNALLDHNQEVVERQRTHVGNLAHALKTPVSVMLAESEGKPGQLAEVVQRQAELMKAQVEHHLRRARASARFPGSGERTPVAPVLDELVRTLDRIYGRRGIDIDAEAAPEIAFLGERQDLLEMLGNVLENACKYGHSEICARAIALDGGAWRLVVEDDGPGLEPHEREEALRRGRRSAGADASTPSRSTDAE